MAAAERVRRLQRGRDRALRAPQVLDTSHSLAAAERVESVGSSGTETGPYEPRMGWIPHTLPSIPRRLAVLYRGIAFGVSSSLYLQSLQGSMHGLVLSRIKSFLALGGKFSYFLARVSWIGNGFLTIQV